MDEHLKEDADHDRHEEDRNQDIDPEGLDIVVREIPSRKSGTQRRDDQVEISFTHSKTSPILAASSLPSAMDC